MLLSSERLRAKIEKNLSKHDLYLKVYDVLASTNDRARELALSGAKANTLVVAQQQTAGRGRQGRSFFSPAGSGIYMSLLLRPARLDEPEHITVAAAVAVACAIEEVAEKPAQIKWVNDVFTDGKKVSGILTEGGFTSDGNPWAVLGIGVNLTEPERGFPDELSAIAGGILPNGAEIQRGRLIARIVEKFLDLYENGDAESLHAAYCARDMLRGKKVYITYCGEEEEAEALGIERDFSLRVRLTDGREVLLRSGEARARSAQ